MGTSTDAYIGYGIQFEEGFEFPWDGNEDFDYSFEEWWQEINNYKNPYNRKSKSSKYFEFKENWEAENPIPFELENCCSEDYPIYILCVKDSVIRASRGNPTPFNPDTDLDVKISKEKLNRFMEFIKKYELSLENPRWLLFSYWG